MRLCSSIQAGQHLDRLTPKLNQVKEWVLFVTGLSTDAICSCGMPLATHLVPRRHGAPYRETQSVFPLTRISSGLAKISAVPQAGGISSSRLAGKSRSSVFTGGSRAGPVRAQEKGLGRISRNCLASLLANRRRETCASRRAFRLKELTALIGCIRARVRSLFRPKPAAGRKSERDDIK
jgi:hypothetical protein